MSQPGAYYSGVNLYSRSASLLRKKLAKLLLFGHCFAVVVAIKRAPQILDPLLVDPACVISANESGPWAFARNSSRRRHTETMEWIFVYSAHRLSHGAPCM